MDWGEAAMASSDDSTQSSQPPDSTPPPPPPPPPLPTPSDTAETLADKPDKPVKEEPPKPQPEPKKPRPPVQRSTNIVERTSNQKAVANNNKSPITQKDLQGLKTVGGTSSSGTASSNQGNPNEDARARGLIMQTFLNAWIRPSTTDRGRNPVLMEIEIDQFGNVKGRKMVSSSGSTTMDASVMNAANAVRRIEGLSQAVARRNPKVTIRFDLD